LRATRFAVFHVMPREASIEEVAWRGSS